MERKIRVLMFGWEFPPFNSGGLGVACLGLARALAEEGIRITFVLPRKFAIDCDFMNIIFTSDTGDYSLLDKKWFSYTTSRLYNPLHRGEHLYLQNLLEEVTLYAQLAKAVAKKEQFDIIHAHDWLTFQAGITAQEVSNKPLIAHVHATEFDRTGSISINQQVYDREKRGMEKADEVIAVSNFTKNMITTHYGIPSSKITVIHNGVEKPTDEYIEESLLTLKRYNKIVLFVGRLTLQKGPDYFLKAAKKVLTYNPNVLFVMVGSGDMNENLIKEAAALGISDKVIFTGFLRDEKLQKVYKAADLFVMPSVSEPFGITSLESLINGTPVLVSKQSGVSEVLTHALKVDFWDITEMANKMLAVLNYHSLKQTLQENGRKEVQEINWKNAAKKTIKLYNKVLKNRRNNTK